MFHIEQHHDTQRTPHEALRLHPRAGFMLLEVLVALVVAALFLGLLAQMLAGAWQGNRIPLERVIALNLARSLAGNLTASRRPLDDGQIGRFVYMTDSAPLVLEARPSNIAPAPDGAPTERPRADKTGSASLQRITITVRGPSGRELSFDTVKLDSSK